MDIVNDLKTDVLSGHRVGLKASADGCLVVHKDPDGFDVSVQLCPLLLVSWLARVVNFWSRS